MKKIVFVLLVVLLSSFLRLWMLNTPDVQGDEHHYIDDAFRYLNRDPYMSARYHSLHHPQPSIGHPFFYQLLLAGVFKIMGVSVFTSRLVSVLSGIFTVLVLFFFNRELGGRVSSFAAYLLAILPMAVRFNRLAYLDSLLTLFVTICALCIWRYLGNHNRLWLLVCGIRAGMAISTKLNGFYVTAMCIGMILFIKSNPLRKPMERVKDAVVFLLPAGFVAFLLNDPRAYFDGILNPSDPAFRLLDGSNIVRILEQYISPDYIIRFLATNLILLSPMVLFIVLYALVKVVTNFKNTTNLFFILWFLPLLNIFIVQGIDVTGAYRWIPLLPPLVLLIAYKLGEFKKNTSNSLIVILTVTLLPFLFLYGWSLVKLPAPKMPNMHNRTLRETFYQGVIRDINYLAPLNAKTILVPQANYPIFSLRQDLSWSYDSSISDADIYVFDHVVLDKKFNSDNMLIAYSSEFQDGAFLERYIYRITDK